VLVAFYLAALLYNAARAAAVMARAPPHDHVCFALLGAYVVAAFVGAFEGGYDTVHTRALPFAAFLSVPTFTVWALAFLHAAAPGGEAPKPPAPELGAADMSRML